MNFPRRILGIPFGWRDRGEVGGTYVAENEANRYTACTLCRSIARVGIEDGKVFLFCGKCKRVLG